MKRLLSLALSIVLIFGMFPTFANAAEVHFVNIAVVHDGKETICRVIEDGAQLMFSGEDLATFGGYNYKIEGNDAYFIRGSKTVRVNIARNSLIPHDGTAYAEHNENIKLRTPVCKVGGVYYFPGAHLLPWLSVTCAAVDGKMSIVSDEVSIWDLTAEFNPEDYKFSFVKSCQELGVDSKWVKTAAAIEGFGLDTIIGWLPSFGGNSDEEHIYYDIFEDMLQDKTCVQESADKLIKASDKAEQWIELLQKGKLLSDHFDDTKEIFGGIASAPVEFATEVGCYLSAIATDDQEKLNALKYIVIFGHDFPDAMVDAASTVYLEYSDRILGILGKGIDVLLEELEDLAVEDAGIIFKAVLAYCGLQELTLFDSAEGIRRVDQHDALAKCCAKSYHEYKDVISTTGIQNTRSAAYLYLYATEQNWSTMSKYAKNLCKTELSEEYRLRAEAAKDMAAQFLSSAYSALNDSPEYAPGEQIRKLGYTDNLKKIFSEFTRYPDSPVSEIDFEAFLQNHPEYIYYAILDVNQDGTPELLATESDCSQWETAFAEVDMLVYRDGEIQLAYENLWSQDSLRYSKANQWAVTWTSGTGGEGYGFYYLDQNLNIHEQSFESYLEYDENRNEISVDYLNGRKVATAEERNAFDQLSARHQFEETIEIIFQPVQSSEMSSELDNNELQQVKITYGDGNEYNVYFHYHASGLLDWVSTSGENAVDDYHYEYDSQNRLVKVVSGNIDEDYLDYRCYEFYYDANGYISEWYRFYNGEECFGKALFGDKGQQIGTEEYFEPYSYELAEYVYNSQGQLLTVNETIECEGVTTSFVQYDYDSQNRISNKYDEDGNLTATYCYDYAPLILIISGKRATAYYDFGFLGEMDIKTALEMKSDIYEPFRFAFYTLDKVSVDTNGYVTSMEGTTSGGREHIQVEFIYSANP